MNTDRSESTKRFSQTQLHQALRSGEKLLWEGGPADRRVFRKDHWRNYLVGLFLIVLSLFLSYALAKYYRYRFIDTIRSIFLLALGLSYAVGVPLHQKRILDRSWYGITDQRVILFTHGEVISLTYDLIPCVVVELEERETFTVYLQTIKLRGCSPNTWDSQSHYRAAMVYISDGPQVAKLIRQQIRKIPLD